MLVFPEATTTSGLGVLPFRRGAFGIARRAAVPIVPIGIDYDRADVDWVGDDPFLPHYLRVLSRRRTECRLRLGPPIDPTNFGTAEALATYARREVQRLLAGEPVVA